MQLSSSILSLPSAIILLLYASPVVTAEQPWPYNLPKHMKYFPDEEHHVKRSLDIQQRLLREKPIGMKKMSLDEGEMFMLDDWIFAGDEDTTSRNTRSLEEAVEGRNTSILEASSPLRPHALPDAQSSLFSPFLRFAPRNALNARGFQCPTGTRNCSSIGAPDSCCGTSDTCMTVQDTGFGTVGCCPQGETCGGGIYCDTSAGYTSCPDSSNGGCCLPGYSCQDVGCVIAGTSTTIVAPATSAARSSSTAVVVVPTSSTPVSSSAQLTSSHSAAACSSGWFSCPASLDGGCCQNGYACQSGAACRATGSSSASAPASTVTPSAPVRPTSVSGSTSAATTGLDTTASLCPTGFYVCSAYYPTGCCRVGRDCATTGTCIPTSSGTVIASDGVTIVAPTGASVATTAAAQGGSCPSGWFSCAASLGGNCCLNGYACGAQCTATAGGNTQVVGKVSPSSASTFSTMSIGVIIFGAAMSGMLMVIL